MGCYRILFKPKTQREIKKLTGDVVKRIVAKIDVLAQNPYGGDVKKLAGSTRTYRLRVGEYRVIYDINEHHVDILKVSHRRDVYK